MLPSLFATVFCTVLPSTTPLESPALHADGSLAAQVGLYVTPTHLSARNFSATPQILALSDAQTWICSLATFLGRIEIFTFLILFTRSFWRK